MLRITILIIVMLCLCAMSACTSAVRVIHTEPSAYGNIYVVDSSDTRCMRFSINSNSDQSCFYRNDPLSLMFACNKMIMGALYLNPNPRKILLIGLGGATIPTAFMKILPESEIHVVELDPAVVRVAMKFFNFQQNAKIQVSVEDGRLFVQRAFSRGEKYDLIVLDAFGDAYIPEHMMTKQFLQEVKGILKQDGVLASNTFSASKTYDRESVTYQSVFGSFYNLKKFTSRVILIKQDNLPPREVLEKNSIDLENKLSSLGVQASWLLPLFTGEQDWNQDARVLIDKTSSMLSWE